MTNRYEVTYGNHKRSRRQKPFSELISRAASGERFLIHRRERPVAALIGSVELQRLERAAQAARGLALSLGQTQELLEKIERQEIHPVMAAFGLWADDPDVEWMADQITKAQKESSARLDCFIPLHRPPSAVAWI